MNCKYRPCSIRLQSLIVLVVLIAAALPAAAQPQRADLKRLVIVGDSLSAGFQSGALLDRLQAHGYAKLVADQARTEMTLPLIGEPGIPNVLVLVSPGPPPVIVPAPGISPGRTNLFDQATNLAVPGARLHDALARRPDFPIDSLTDLILGLPGLLGGVSRSQVEWAEALHPTTVIIWIGNNDALGAAISADASSLTPVAQFEADYTALMNRMAATGATLVVANIPDVTVVPFLTSAERVAELVGLPLAFIGPVLGIAPGDFVTPDAFGLIGGILTGVIPGPLPGNVVLNAGEVAAIRAAVNAYNAVIAAQARSHGAALVDVNALASMLDTRGHVVGGRRLTTDFLGGLFSLDGVHPTNTGYAVIGNEFIHVLNARFAAGIPPAVVEQIASNDPLILPGVGRPARALGNMTNESVSALRAILARR